MSGIIEFIRSLFPSKDDKRAPVRPLPSWPEIVEMMYNQPPFVSPYVDEIIKVVYSADREKRYIITRNRNYGFYQFQMEQLCAWDDEEWLYISHDPNALPAMWHSFGYSGGSFFGTEQDAWNELVSTPEYKEYFDP